jgi:hypothetical protein
MQHSDFHIGTEFFTAAGKWKCTDIGARVVVAISLESRETVRVHYTENGERQEERFISDDPCDLLGPPCSVVEYVFDEYDIEGCYATAEEVPSRQIENSRKAGCISRQLRWGTQYGSEGYRNLTTFLV